MSWISQAQKSDDFKRYSIINQPEIGIISYYNSLIDQELLQRHIIKNLQKIASFSDLNVNDLRNSISIENIIITFDSEMIHSKMLKGYAVIQLKETDEQYVLVPLANHKSGLRDKNNTENEFSVVGPKVGFVENIEINLHLLRERINVPDLIFKEITIGTMSHTKIVIAYIESITNQQYLNTMIQRLTEINFDVVFDSSQLDQIISDNSFTPFPLFLSTERVDRILYALISGQIAVLSDGSPYVISGPSTLFDYFISPEDYYLPWILGSFFRLFRIFGVFFSLFATSIYTAVLTYHYQMIPNSLLGPIIFSRNNVPFQPILEVIFLEITIEFLREAGARLPTKIGQTLGIVGGIVIGQASVEAALTSNILLIIVALSALASFTTPIYKMSNTIRFLRFPLIILAAIWGGLGIVVGLCFLFVHLMRLKSLGTPYFVPLYPFRFKNFADSFIRSTYKNTSKRPEYLRPKSIWRYRPYNQSSKNNFEEE